MAAFVVRPVVAGDFDQWLPLWVGYNAFYGRSGATSLPDRITQTTWSRFLDHDEAVHALVAEAAGELIGLAHYLFHRTTVSVALTCYLQDLFTETSVRGQGVGAALIESVYERAGAGGAARVYWHTHETNVIARRLYDHIGDNSGFLVYRKDLPTGG